MRRRLDVLALTAALGLFVIPNIHVTIGGWAGLDHRSRSAVEPNEHRPVRQPFDLLSDLIGEPVGAQVPPIPTELQQKEPDQRKDTDDHPPHPLHEIDDAMVRLPLAALLGAALALRPKRRGTPPRTTPVIQTQIVLAVVGAVIMLVIGASLARAFGIVGAANLIRYRSKIDDPKDAVVMLCTLAVGLATGVGLYALAVFSTVFLVAALWVIESFEPESTKPFDLKIKIGKQTDELRPEIESILRRFDLRFEIRASSDEEVSYEVAVPLEVKTDRVTNAILKLDRDGHGAVDWTEKKKAK